MTVAQRYVEAFISKLAEKLATVEAKVKVNTLADTLRERCRQGGSRHTGKQKNRPGPNILQHSGRGESCGSCL